MLALLTIRAPQASGPGWNSSLLARNVGRIFAERGREIDQMLLLLAEDLANVFRDRILAERLAFAHTLAIRADRVTLVLQIGAQHLLGLFRLLDGFRRRSRHAAEIVDVLRDDECVAKLLARMLLELCRNAHVLRAFEHL